MLYDELKPYAVQIRRRGQLTIPRQLRESLDIGDGDTLTALQFGDALVLASRVLQTPGLTERLASMLDEEGVTLADMLADLPRIREELTSERYRVDPQE